MSGASDPGELILHGMDMYTKQPLLAAQTAETWSKVPLNQANAALAQSQVPYWGAETGFVGANTVKQQIDNEWNRLTLDQSGLRNQGRGQRGDPSSYTLPATGAGDTGVAPPPPTQGGGGRPIGPGTPPAGGGDTTRGLTAFAQPTTYPPGYQPPPGPAPALPPSTQLAMHTLQPQPQPGPPPASAQMPSMAQQTQLGFGGVTADQPLMMGATTAQPVSGTTVANAPPPAPPPAGSVALAQATPPPAQPQPQQPQLSPTKGSPSGAYFEPLGIVVPPSLTTGYWRALGAHQDTTTALANIVKQRNNALLQLAIPAQDPQSWAQATETAWRNGFLSDAEYGAIHTNFAMKPEFLRKLQPEETQRMNEAMAQKGMIWNPQVHDYVPSAGYHSTDAPESTPRGHIENGRWIPDVTTPMERAGGAGGATPPAQTPPAPGTPQSSTTPPATGGAFDAYAAAIHSHEGSSPTMGDYGFIPSTKIAVAKKYAPDAVAGMTDAQIAAANLPPDAQTKMLQGFTADNAVALANGGMRSSGANLGMAHYIGAQGVLNLLKVPPDTTMTEMERRGLLTPGSVANNPELQGNTTARGFIQWAQRKYGNNTLTADDISGATKVAGPGGGGTPGSTQTTPPAASPGGGTQGKPEFAPGVPEIIAHNIKTDNAAVDGANDAALAAQGAQRTVRDMLDRTPRLQEAGAFGYAAEFRANANSLIHMVLKLPGDNDLAKKFDSINFESQTDREAFIKEATQLALAQEAAMPGVRSGIGLATMVGKGSPSLNMQGDTVRELLNRMLVGHVMTQDYANGLNDKVQAAQATYGEDPFRRNYSPVQRQYDKEWNDPKSIHSPNVYLGAATLLTDNAKTDDWKKRLDGPQQAAALALAMRVNPDWLPPGYRRAPQ